MIRDRSGDSLPQSARIAAGRIDSADGVESQIGVLNGGGASKLQMTGRSGEYQHKYPVWIALCRWWPRSGCCLPMWSIASWMRLVTALRARSVGSLIFRALPQRLNAC